MPPVRVAPEGVTGNEVEPDTKPEPELVTEEALSEKLVFDPRALAVRYTVEAETVAETGEFTSALKAVAKAEAIVAEVLPVP